MEVQVEHVRLAPRVLKAGLCVFQFVLKVQCFQAVGFKHATRTASPHLPLHRGGVVRRGKAVRVEQHIRLLTPACAEESTLVLVNDLDDVSMRYSAFKAVGIFFSKRSNLRAPTSRCTSRRRARCSVAPPPSRASSRWGGGGAADCMCIVYLCVPVCTCVCCRWRRCKLDPDLKESTTQFQNYMTVKYISLNNIAFST